MPGPAEELELLEAGRRLADEGRRREPRVDAADVDGEFPDERGGEELLQRLGDAAMIARRAFPQTAGTCSA
jgi:hypothetical protein